jgi:hypothetical protein
MPDLDWTTQLETAGGLANVVLYRMAIENPHHNDAKIVADKMLVIGRVYSAAVTRGGGERNDERSDLPVTLYEHLARLVVAQHGELDQRLTDLNKLERVEPDNLVGVVECHAFLSKILIAGINEWRAPTAIRGVRARDSFVSKYLHFHAPMVFFILDSVARNKLKQRGLRGWRPTWPTAFRSDLRTDYAKYCLRVHAYAVREFGGQAWTPRLVDGELLGYLPY